MAQHTQVSADPQEVQKAQELWRHFTQAMKWSVIAVVVILALLAAAFINW